MSFNRSLFKQTIVYTQQNTTQQKKKKGVNYDIHNNMKRTQGYMLSEEPISKCYIVYDSK